MPRKGYKCITITEKTHQQILKRAAETNRTMKEYIEHLITENSANQGE
jgi:hypothetical protein